MQRFVRVLLVIFVLILSTDVAVGSDAPALAFRDTGKGGFTFDTGVLRGRLHDGARSLGLTQVEHLPTGARLDRSNGLLSHYRVFTRGRRYGTGAWDWSSVARLRRSNVVEVIWDDSEDRPFSMKAVYRLKAAEAIEVETVVQSRGTLVGFEVFLASYFDSAFTNVQVGLGEGRFLEATEDRGVWQMYPRQPMLRELIEDNRWQLEPHPVAWVYPATWSGLQATVLRRSVSLELTAELRAPAENCFAVATPHQTEGHYSVYFSLFGRDMQPTEMAWAKVELRVRSGL
jgi:hypothetical protein